MIFSQMYIAQYIMYLTGKVISEHSQWESLVNIIHSIYQFMNLHNPHGVEFSKTHSPQSYIKNSESIYFTAEYIK